MGGRSNLLKKKKEVGNEIQLRATKEALEDFGQKASISVPDFDAHVLTEFVNFLKTDIVRDMKHYALQLLLLADNYRVCKLGIQCIDYIYDHVVDFDLTDLLRALKIVYSPKLSRTVHAYF